MEKPLKLLMVEDNPADAELVLRELRRAGFTPECHRVETEADFVASLHSGLDIILSDFVLPRFSGPRALDILNESGVDVPFIIVSGTIGEDSAVAAIKQGAVDYLLKDRLARLGAAVAQALEQRALREERKRAEEEIRTQLRELQRSHEAMLGREHRVVELKTEVNELLAQLGQPPRYSSPTTP